MTDSILRSYQYYSTTTIIPFPAPEPVIALLVGETEGFSIDATTSGGIVGCRDTGTPANNLSNVTLNSSNLVQSGTSAKYVKWDDSTIHLISSGDIAQQYDTARSLFGVLQEPAGTNLLIQSVDLSHAAWSPNQLTNTGGSTAPDGTSTAYNCVPTVTAGGHAISHGSVGTGVNTVSIYAKANGYNWIGLEATAHALTSFNVSAGTVGTVGSGTATIESIGNGWYRCKWLVNVTSGTVIIYVMQADNTSNHSGDTTSGVLCWLPQMEDGSVATSPIPSTSGVGNRGIDLITAPITTVPWDDAAATLYVDFKMLRDATGGGQTTLKANDSGANSDYHALGVSGAGDHQYTVSDGYVNQCAFNVGGYTANTRIQLTGAAAATGYAINLNGTNTTSGAGTMPTIDANISVGSTGSSVPMLGYIYRVVIVPRRVVNGDLPTWRYNF